MKLYYRQRGQGTPIVILHGLFGCSDNWFTIARKLEEEYRVILPDLRNHGQSPHSEEWDYTAMSDDLYDLFNELQLDSANLMGHSMGGKVAIEFAARYPEKINKIVVVDIAPKYYPVHHMEILNGLRSIDLNTLQSRNEADKKLAETIQEPGIRQFLLKNLARNDDKFYWKINLDVIEKKIENVGEGMDDAIEIDLPALFIRGEKSDYILNEDYDLIRDIFPKAKIATIKNSGHWVHAEKPAELLDMLTYFLKN